MENANGQLFSDALIRMVKEKFHYFTGRKRLYFDGSVKLANVGYVPG
jgi:cysteine desulfurase/selenocysteine lyase